MDRLGTLPPNLKDSYDAIYRRNTKKLGHHDLAHVERAFLWILGADPQPPGYVIVQAVRFSTEGKVDEKVSKQTLLDLCQHLLVIGSGKFQYTLASVKEWVESRHWTLAQAQCHITKLCLSHLLTIHEHSLPLFNGPRKRTAGHSRRDRFHYSIQDYIQLHWPKYVKAVKHTRTFGREIVLLLKEFLGSPMKSSGQYRRWVSYISSDDAEDSMGDTGDIPDPEQHGEAHINLNADDANDYRRFIGSDAWQLPFGISSREIKPSGFALLAMVSFGFTDILMECGNQ